MRKRGAGPEHSGPAVQQRGGGGIQREEMGRSRPQPRADIKSGVILEYYFSLWQRHHRSRVPGPPPDAALLGYHPPGPCIRNRILQARSRLPMACLDGVTQNQARR